MRALKIIFGGPGAVAVDWNASVDGLPAVAQRAGVAMMTREGTDKFLPGRGTSVSADLADIGAADLLGVQHALNFGALKARADMQAYEGEDRSPADRIDSIRATLTDLRGQEASVALRVTNQAGESTREVIRVE